MKIKVEILMFIITVINLIILAVTLILGVKK
jgi:hypothetical protein